MRTQKTVTWIMDDAKIYVATKKVFLDTYVSRHVLSLNLVGISSIGQQFLLVRGSPHSWEGKGHVKSVDTSVQRIPAATAVNAADEDDDDCDGCQDPDGRGGATLPVQVQEAVGAGSHDPGAAVAERDLIHALSVLQALAAVEFFNDPPKLPFI